MTTFNFTASESIEYDVALSREELIGKLADTDEYVALLEAMSNDELLSTALEEEAEFDSHLREYIVESTPVDYILETEGTLEEEQS